MENFRYHESNKNSGQAGTRDTNLSVQIKNPWILIQGYPELAEGLVERSEIPIYRETPDLELAEGLEPPTCALQVRCSTTELCQLYFAINQQRKQI